MEHTRDYLKTESVSKLVAEIGNEVYVASSLLERLENVGRINCSGHYLRQELARYAGELLRKNIVF